MRKTLNIRYIYLFAFVLISFLSKSQNIDSLKNELKTEEDKSIIYNKLSDACKAKLDFKLTKIYADSALFYSLKNKNSIEKGTAYINLGDYYYYTSNYDSSVYFYKKAALIFEKIDNNENIASAYSNIGAINFAIGNYEKAIKNFQYAVKFQKKTNKPEEIAVIYNNIATVYYNIDNYENAINFYCLSLK